MDYYCFVEWEDLQPETMPKLPEGTPFLLLAGTPEISRWALFECELPDDFRFNDSIELVNEELEILLYSANYYPPALALARADLEISCKDLSNISKELFSEIFSKILKKHLQLQRFSSYFLAQSQVEEEDYLVKGAFYWITGFDQETNEVEWVSDSFYIFQNPASDFGLEPQLLRRYFTD
jgi:hypothetical protein